ncbi:hypothetical protein C8F01DRAFT_953277, partial [Mycena amicta]
ENDVYCSQLWGSRRGYPLYMPSPQANLPQEYQQRGVCIGDVGRVTPDGTWDFFFNIFLPGDHPINGNRVPADFSPLPTYDYIDVFCHDFAPGSHVRSTSVQAWNVDSESQCVPLPSCDSKLTSSPELPPELHFDCQGPTGALLALPNGSSLRKLENIELMRRYAARNAEGWYRYINEMRGRRMVNGGLYLITGSEKAHSGGIATFQN